MSVRALLAAAILTIIVASCSTPIDNSDGDDDTDVFEWDRCTETIEGRCWTFLGPKNLKISSVTDTPWGLFVGTQREGFGKPTGVFRFDTSTRKWQSVGLDHAYVGSMLMVPGDTARLLAGMIPDADGQTDAAVFATEDGGETWLEWDGGLARDHDRRSWAFSLAMDPGDPNRLFMGQAGTILRSENGGRDWNYVLGDEPALAMGVHTIIVSPAQDGRIWAGATTAFFSAIIHRSIDWGESWEHFHQGNFDNSIYVLVADPENPDRLWSAEAIGRIRRSLDGGTTWETIFVVPRPGAVDGLILTDGHLFAATWEERSEVESQLGLYRSNDGGDSWESISVPEQARGAISGNLKIDNGGALLIGTAFGVWRVTR